MSYDKKFRRHVLKVRETEKLSLAKAAKRFGIGKQTIYNWTKRLEEKSKRTKPWITLDEKALRGDIETYPDAYQYERAQRLGVSRGGVYHALKRLGVTYKKTLKHPKACAEKRAIFCRQIEQCQASGKPLVYLDESGFAHDMPRTHGYSFKGERCFGIHDWGAKGRTNAIGAILGTVLLTTSLFEANITTKIFNAWVKEDLIPKLPQESVVILDNAAFHKSPEMQEALRTAGHSVLYLPPYSPDLNPIEHKWAQAKSLRRKTGCTIQDLFLTENL